jgi:hypothetical protein
MDELMIEDVIQNSRWIRNDAIAGQAVAISCRAWAVQLREQSRMLLGGGAQEFRRRQAMHQAEGEPSTSRHMRAGRAGPSESSDDPVRSRR